MPDGQPHIQLNRSDELISCSIISTEDLFLLGLIVDIFRRKDKNRKINLDIHYLLGSRMDRPISDIEPNTLKVVCDYLNSLNVNIDITFPHSQSTLDRLNCKHNIYGELNFIEDGVVNFCDYGDQITLILPDSGAEKRFWNDHKDILQILKTRHNIICDVVGCTKHRDMTTGKLSGFSVNGDIKNKCIIIDDVIDGGGTYTGLSKELILAGAKKIYLVVYHSIFSKGLPIKGIDGIYTSNSFTDWESDDYLKVKKVL